MSYLASRMFLCLLGALAIGLVVGWLLRRFSAIEREAELTGEIDLRDERVGALEGDLGEREHKIFSLGQDLTRIQQKLPGLESTLAERDDQVMSLTMDLDGWKQKVPGLESQLAETMAAREQLGRDLEQRDSQLQESAAQSSQLNAELEALREELASHKKRASEEAANLTAQSDEQKQELASLQAQIVAATEASNESSRRFDGLQQEFDALQVQSDAQANDRREREQALTELRLSLKNQEAERASLAEQLTALGPVASRVDSQDMTIVSLNNDLRARDTAIKSLRDELAANAELNRELREKAQSFDSVQAELNSTRAQLTQASTAETGQKETLERAKEKAANAEREWRNRLRIAESGKTQVQADLYRRQEQIQRLELQLKETQKEAQAGREATRQANQLANASSAQGLFGSGAQSQSGAFASTLGAGAPKQIDDRDWRARLRVAESARRRAEVQSQRDAERLRSLEAQLRALNDRPTPGSATALSASGAALATAASVTSATPVASAAPVASVAPLVPAASKGAEANHNSGESRFLDAKPKDVDDLREIKGVGKVLQKTLNSLGIYQFRQIAAFTDEDIAWVDDRLKFKGRIERDNWVKQATKLHKKKS